MLVQHRYLDLEPGECVIGGGQERCVFRRDLFDGPAGVPRWLREGDAL